VIEIYTDGSCGSPAPCPGGWAFVVYQSGELLHEASGGARLTSNNRMEMLAIVRALVWADGRECVIFSDSQLCINTLTTWGPGWRSMGWRKRDGKDIANLDIVQRALPLFERSKAVLRWVRGHAGTVGNERADQLAGAARAALLQFCAPPV
jgi:ribonuclease HI